MKSLPIDEDRLEVAVLYGKCFCVLVDYASAQAVGWLTGCRHQQRQQHLREKKKLPSNRCRGALISPSGKRSETALKKKEDLHP